MNKGSGHPLPDSGEARHNEIPEHLEAEKGRGQDPAAITTPHPEGVAPDGESYRYDDLGRGPPTDKGVGDDASHEPEPGP
ncbi:MAG TPA: hypothetical protein VF552_16265 [Allosphingosinicella sp.]|jgi:hypothetical protein